MYANRRILTSKGVYIMSKQMAKAKECRSFRLSDNIYAKIERIAKEKHISKAEVVACLVAAYEDDEDGEQTTLYDGQVNNEKLEMLFMLAAEM